MLSNDRIAQKEQSVNSNYMQAAEKDIAKSKKNRISGIGVDEGRIRTNDLEAENRKLREQIENMQLQLDVKMKTVKVQGSNHVDTMYGREGFKYHINDILEQDAALYISKDGMTKLLNRKNLRLNSDGKLELLARLDNLKLDTIIHKSRNVVNSNSMQKTEGRLGTGQIADGAVSAHQSRREIASHGLIL